MAKIAGIAFDFGGETLTIPPLSLGDLELLQERLAALQIGSLEPQSVSTVIDATLAALQRNYPDMTRPRVAALIDLGNMAQVIQCVMDVAGMYRQALAEGADPGKAQAAPMALPTP